MVSNVIRFGLAASWAAFKSLSLYVTGTAVITACGLPMGLAAVVSGVAVSVATLVATIRDDAE